MATETNPAADSTRFANWTFRSLVERAALETFVKKTSAAPQVFLAAAAAKGFGFGEAYRAYKVQLAAVRAEAKDDTGSEQRAPG